MSISSLRSGRSAKVVPSETQRVAYLVAPGRIELRETPVPRPEAGQVVLRIERALVGGTDRKAFARGHPQIPMPGPFGHRYAGVVARVGSAVTAFAVGQPVMGVHSAPCLDCDSCRRQLWHLCPDVMKEKVLGAFGQYLCIPAPVVRQNLFPRPAELRPDHAALLEPLACVVHALEMVDWRGVERVLVLGLGAMGLLFTQLLPHYTRAERVAAGRRGARLELARRFGAEEVYDVQRAPLLEQLDGRQRFDCVLECTGQLAGWQTAFDSARPHGQVVLFGGLPRGTQFPIDSYRLHYEEIRLMGSFHFSPRDVARARELLLAGGLELDPLISDCLSLEQLPEAMRRLQQGDGMQYAIDPWK